MSTATRQSDGITAVDWHGDAETGTPVIIDQTQLPSAITTIPLQTLGDAREAIIALRVRGAPAIGIAAAYSLAKHCCTWAFAHDPGLPGDDLEAAVIEGVQTLGPARPTAVNLIWALTRMRDCFDRHSSLLTARESAVRLLMEARRIHREDAELCNQIGRNGAKLLPAQGGVYTHCNTGAFATGGIGTAIGCIVSAHRNGKKLSVYAGETRPLLQGARLTATELIQNGIECRLGPDSAAGHLMASGAIDVVIVGADRIAANGDTANKIGTYQLAILAKHHAIPFYVAAPYSTFDLSLPDGTGIEIEDRSGNEVRTLASVPIAPAEVKTVNPAFDVTPGHLITAIITERGVINQPSPGTISAMMDDGIAEHGTV